MNYYRLSFFKKLAQEDVEQEKCHHCREDLQDNEWTQTRSGKVCTECEDRRCLNCYQISDEPLIVNRSGTKICQECNTDTICPNCETEIDEDDRLVEANRWRAVTNPTHGCTNCMAKCSACNRVVREKDEMSVGPDDEYYCEDCYGDNWTNCDECGDVVHIEDSIYIDDVGRSFCNYCFNRNYGYCYECNDPTPLQNLHEDDDGNSYCEECKPELLAGTELPKDYAGLNKIEEISFNKFDRVLNQLKRLLPISPRDLARNHPRISQQCRDLIAFAQGRELTSELVAEFEKDMPKQNFPIQYSTWRSQLQRSVSSAKPQLVINVLASEKMLSEMKADNTYTLFDKVNDTSKESGHPYVKDQLGWIRVELHPEEKYILIDEIQTDHMNAIDRIKTEHHMGITYKNHLASQLGLTDEQMNSYLAKYKSHIREFTDIAIEAATKFARANGYNKVFYHTYESGKALKHNKPPASLYTELPVRHYFELTEEKPFGLEGQFFTRQAKVKARMKLFKKIAAFMR